MDATPGAKVWLGLREDIDRATLRRWIEGHDVAAMLSAMNEFEVERGLGLLRQGGTSTLDRPGVTLTELQEPTSFSVLAEYENFGVTEDQATLGLGWEVAASRASISVDIGVTGSPSYFQLGLNPRVKAAERYSTSSRLKASTFFSARLVRCSDRVELGQPSFAVLVVTRGFRSTRLGRRFGTRATRGDVGCTFRCWTVEFHGNRRSPRVSASGGMTAEGAPLTKLTLVYEHYRILAACSQPGCQGER